MRVQRYGFFLNLQTFARFFSKNSNLNASNAFLSKDDGGRERSLTRHSPCRHLMVTVPYRLWPPFAKAMRSTCRSRIHGAVGRGRHTYTLHDKDAHRISSRSPPLYNKEIHRIGTLPRHGMYFPARAHCPVGTPLPHDARGDGAARAVPHRATVTPWAPVQQALGARWFYIKLSDGFIQNHEMVLYRTIR